MTRPIKIAPSILACDFTKIGAEIKKIETAGADCVHVDVMDGHFVPNLTIGPPVIKALRKHCSLKFDVHLMISPVHKYIKDFSDAGADIITFHPEATENMKETISLIKSLDKKVGVSLSFNYLTNGNDWYHRGFSSKGDPLHEIWAFRNP